MRAAIYIRVSTDEQVKEGYSISAQKQKLHAFCQSQDWVIAGFYADEGISAKDTNRPQLQRMLSDIENGLIDCVLVYRLDRLTRSVFDLYKMLDVFDKHNCSFKSATEVYDTTSATGRMFITFVATLAQWERENLAERVRFGQQEKARQGKYVANRIPLGYELDKKNWKLQINEEEARTVKKIFTLYQNGYGMHKLARHLNDCGIKTKFGNTWSDNTVMKILRNKTFTGAIVWDGIISENTHEPIIPIQEFEEVQHLIKRRAGVHPKTISSDYIFSSTMRCPSCEGTLSGNFTHMKQKDGSKLKYKHYRCRNHIRGVCAHPLSVSEEKMEEAFLEYISKLHIEDSLYGKVAQKAFDITLKPDSGIEEELTKELNKIQKRKKKFQFAWADDAIEYEDFKARMEELRKQEEIIKKELEEISPVPKINAISKQQIQIALKNINQNWNALSLQEKKSVVSSIIKQIYFHKEGGGRWYRVIIDDIDFL